MGIDSTMSLAEIVGRRRGELGLTQRTIALKLDVTVQFISNIETGRTLSSDRFCLQLAEVLKVKPELLVLAAHRDRVPQPVRWAFTRAIKLSTGELC